MEFKENNEKGGPIAQDLYPTVPTAPPSMEPYTPMSYRLQKINEIQRMLEDERDVRQNLSKKYHRISKGISNADTAIVAVSMGLGVAGVGLLSTIVAAPVVIMMEAAALGTGLLSIIGGQVNKRMVRKAEKHEKIKTIAEAKLNTISDLVSKALNDNVVSQEEFTLILNELAKYRQMKEEVRSNIKVALDEETKSSLINQGREDAIESFQKMFNKNRASFRRIIDTHSHNPHKNEVRNNDRV
jgi:hypothetical protein